MLIVYALPSLIKIIPITSPINPIIKEKNVIPLLIIISSLFEYVTFNAHVKRLIEESADKMQAIVMNVRAAIMLEQLKTIEFDSDRQIKSPHVHSSQIV
jgi:hypothetical protein